MGPSRASPSLRGRAPSPVPLFSNLLSPSTVGSPWRAASLAGSSLEPCVHRLCARAVREAGAGSGGAGSWGHLSPMPKDTHVEALIGL